MKIQGVDQLVLEQVQEKTQRKSVENAERARIATRQQGQQQDNPAGRYDLGEAVEQVNKAMDAFNVRLHFQIDQESGDPYVLVIDKAEGKIIRRIPPDNLIKMAAEMQQVVGLLVNELV